MITKPYICLFVLSLYPDVMSVICRVSLIAGIRNVCPIIKKQGFEEIFEYFASFIFFTQ